MNPEPNHPALEGRHIQAVNSERIYSPWQVGWSAVIGGPPAGGYALACNYHAIGRTRAARFSNTLGWAALGLHTWLIVSVFENGVRGSIFLPLVFLLGLREFSKRTQLNELERRRRLGGDWLSNWTVLWIGLAFAVGGIAVISVVTFAWYMIFD